MTNQELQASEFDPYYGRYINKLSPNTDLWNGFQQGKDDVLRFFQNLPSDKWLFQYAPNKWTIKEVLQHLIDTERIFAYRCFRISRGDDTALANFDQDRYITPSAANKKSPDQLLSEFKSTRDFSISLLHSLSPENLKNIGQLNDNNLSARAAAFTIIGHEIWHMDIIKERYLQNS